MNTNMVRLLLPNTKGKDVVGVRMALSNFLLLESLGDDFSHEYFVSLANLLKKDDVSVVGSEEALKKLNPFFEKIGLPSERLVSFKNPYPLETGGGLFTANTSELKVPTQTKTVFLVDYYELSLMELRKHFQKNYQVMTFTDLMLNDSKAHNYDFWVPLSKNIYPIEIPRVDIRTNLDLLIVDCPSRNLSLMPNGLGYLNNALKKTTVDYQILDLDIISYHRYHVHRLFDMGGEITLAGGRKMPEDPWAAEHYDLWTNGGGGVSKLTGRNQMIDFFQPLIDEVVGNILVAKPKIVGFSIQGCNEAFTEEVARRVKENLPDVLIVVGGFSCYNADVGLKAFPLADYMCVGESDVTVGPLMEALARGERPTNQAGVLSRFDTPDYTYIPAPMAHNLDKIEFPKYEWMDLSIYRNFNDYQLTPIIASRGCRWSRCSFCAERFYWRIRTPENFVDELEWLVSQGCYLFMFNESDLGGMPQRVVEICDEIIKRGLHKKVKLTGQLRVNKLQDKAFFTKLREANFVALRFGIDAFSENTLRLQKKGYTTDMVSQNLKDCWESGIFTEVNWVIGVPGETDEDVEEGIQLVLKNAKYIGRLANINPLILVNGGVYWIDPESHNIKFKEPRESLYEKYPRALPADTWWSEKPYIDAAVRKARFERIVIELHDAGFEVGPWAARIIEDVKHSRDQSRVAKKEGSSDYAGVFTVDSEKEKSKAGPAKGAAQPPLFGELGEAPKFVVGNSTYRILKFNGFYYALPEAMINQGTVVSEELLKTPGIIRAATEAEVRAAVEESLLWADTRGQYDDQSAQAKNGAYMRVNSFSETALVVRSKEKIKSVVHFENTFYGVIEASKSNSNDYSPVSFVKGIKTRLQALPQGAGNRDLIKAVLPPSLLTNLKNYFRAGLPSTGISQTNKKLSLVEIAMVLLRGFVKSLFKQRNQTNEGFAFSIGAQPELFWSSSNYNLVKFDGNFYVAPQGQQINWDNPSQLMQMKRCSSLKDIHALEEFSSDKPMVRKLTPGKKIASTTKAGATSKSVQKLVKDIPKVGYKIVAYEGWYYGIPNSLGEIQLSEVDIMERPGVFRDVSAEVVESEILEELALQS